MIIEMKIIYSKIVANVLSLYYNGVIKYHYINENGYWEYKILDDWFNNEVLYASKGLR